MRLPKGKDLVTGRGQRDIIGVPNHLKLLHKDAGWSMECILCIDVLVLVAHFPPFLPVNDSSSFDSFDMIFGCLE